MRLFSLNSIWCSYAELLPPSFVIGNRADHFCGPVTGLNLSRYVNCAVLDAVRTGICDWRRCCILQCVVKLLPIFTRPRSRFLTENLNFLHFYQTFSTWSSKMPGGMRALNLFLTVLSLVLQPDPELIGRDAGIRYLCYNLEPFSLVDPSAFFARCKSWVHHRCSSQCA